jgi:hypothetical protein
MSDKTTMRYFADGKKPVYFTCRKCGWKKGPGVDSWDGRGCKCGHSDAPNYTCGACHGMGTVPYNIGTQPCSKCDGSGLVGPVPVVR